MFITHVFAIFKSKQFVNYLNGYNKITLVNYNLQYMFRIFYDFFINLEMREKRKLEIVIYTDGPWAVPIFLDSP
jgi:hypothetical protein